MSCVSRLLMCSVVGCFALFHNGNSQSVAITGTVLDSVTGIPVANATVTLTENSGVTALTDADGVFTLAGATGVAHRLPSGFVGSSSDMTTVQFFNARGERVYHGAAESSEFDKQKNAPGLYFAKLNHRSGARVALVSESGIKHTRNAAALEEQFAGLGRIAATHALSISKTYFATKSITVTGETANAGTVRLRAVVPTLPVHPMLRISLNKPAFASASSGVWRGPSLANDTSCYNGWESGALPVWIAYDLSSIPVAQRQKILVVWYDPSIGGYPGSGTTALPRDYTIETNTAPTGASAPTTGWVTVARITGNTANSRHHETHMAGANWIRMNITGSGDTFVHIDLDVFSVPDGVIDSWLYMGDSITSMTLARPWCTLQTHVRDGNALAYPPLVDAAVGGTSSWTGITVIDTLMASTPARFVVLAYGTNDHPTDGASTLFGRMDTLVMKIIAAGRIPVVPILPWPNSADQTEALQKVAMLHQLWDKYPTQLLKGPDLYTLFKDRSDLIPPGDVHPNGAGQEVLRQAWAVTMLGCYQ